MGHKTTYSGPGWCGGCGADNSIDAPDEPMMTANVL